jgi:hypothetical protein
MFTTKIGRTIAIGHEWGGEDTAKVTNCTDEDVHDENWAYCSNGTSIIGKQTFSQSNTKKGKKK